MARRNSAETQVPGISRYPDLLAQFEKQVFNLQKDCNTCEKSTVVAQFATKVAGRRRIDSLSRRPTGQA